MPPSPTIPTPKKHVFAHPRFKAFAHGTKKFNRGTLTEASVGKAASVSGFDFPTQLVGSTPDGRLTIYYDPSTGTAGLKNAQDVLSAAPQIITWNDEVFGYKGGQHSVVVAAVNGNTDGTGGAYHYGCDFTSGNVIYVDTATGASAVVIGLYEAELSECYMGPNAGLGQKNTAPWNCGYSNGEGLSRYCADEICAMVGAPNALEALGFGAASAWNTTNDWISKTETTDEDYDSIGAAITGIDWLVEAGYHLWQIAQAPASTMENVYEVLTGKSGFYSVLVSAVKALPGGIGSDFPFTGGADPQTAVPSQTPTTTTATPAPSPTTTTVSPTPTPTTTTGSTPSPTTSTTTGTPAPPPKPEEGFTGELVYVYEGGILVTITVRPVPGQK